MLAGFFFQAEDGIRNRNVTGVQTCALPISLGRPQTPHTADATLREDLIVPCAVSEDVLKHAPDPEPPYFRVPKRSEERSVGKECSPARWPPSLTKTPNPTLTCDVL